MSSMPWLAVHLIAAYVPPKSTLPETMLSPTTTLPSAETPQASLKFCPPGRSPRPVKEGWARDSIASRRSAAAQAGRASFEGMPGLLLGLAGVYQAVQEAHP